MKNYTTIHDYIEGQENNYERPIPLNGSWDWSMKEHIKLTELYKNSQLSTGKNDFKPVKNITRRILGLQHVTEDIELKDVNIYVNDSEKYHLSFLVKKYHDDVFAIENDLDTFFDKLNISRIDFGGGLSKQLDQPAPEVVPLQSIAFCDQTDMLSGPIGIKHYYSPDQLLDKAQFGWGNEANGATITLEALIALSQEEKLDDNTDDETATTPGRYIEIYETHGNLPTKFANMTDTSGKYETRLFISAFYQKKGSDEKTGVILYTALESKSPFKLVKRSTGDEVYGRALAFGGAEELFDAQVWVNYDMIRIQNMLDSASKTILKASGPEGKMIATRNKISDMENNEIIDVGEGGDLGQVDTFPRNMALFDRSVEQWEAHAQQMGQANDAILGKSPTAGTPFKLQELVTETAGKGHENNRAQYARHIEEIYTDWILPHIKNKITQGAKFLSTLTLDELQRVSESMVTNMANERIKEVILEGNTITPDEVELFKDLAREEFKKKGNKHFVEILKGEFKNTPLAVKVDVAGKSKNLAGMTDKLVNIFRFVFSNPQGFTQVMQMPGMAKAFNEILEFSGISPVDFSDVGEIAEQIQAPEGQPSEQAVPSTPAELPLTPTA